MQQPPPLRFRGGARGFWLALGFLTLLVVIGVALFHLEEDWRGARAFAAARKDLEVKGESLDYRHFVVPPVPDDQNLAMAPLFVRELHYEVNAKTHTYTFGPGVSHPKDLADMPYGDDKHPIIKMASYELGRLPNLAGFQQFFRQKKDAFPHPTQPGAPADDVLLALTRYGPTLDELARAAAERPRTRFPLDWNRQEFWGLSLSHYNLEQCLVRTLCLRASANLTLAHTADALRDLELGLRLCRDMGREHLLIGTLVEISCLTMVLNDVWQGLAAREWSADELARLQTDLEAFDLLADFADSMRLERALTVYNFDYLKRTHNAAIFTIDSVEQSDDAATKANHVLGWLVPGGWFDENKAVVSRFHQDYMVTAVDEHKHRVFPDRTRGSQPAWRDLTGSFRLALARVVLSIFESLPLKYARSQTALDQAVTACALERFNLDHRAYPPRLDALVPDYLKAVPPDIIDGAPMRYRLSPDGRYVLHGVGWDGRDEGGRVEWSGLTRLDAKRGDWVWQYSELINPDEDK